jgi:sulfite reductase beta subunit-like hemoprotein
MSPGGEKGDWADDQTFQFHGIIKKHLKPAMQAINRSCLDSIAACGDVSKWFLAKCHS